MDDSRLYVLNLIIYILGDGIFDTLSNEEIKSCIDLGLSKELITKDIHNQAGLSIDIILKTSLKRQSMDNITCVMLTFEGFEKLFKNLKDDIQSSTSSTTDKLSNIDQVQSVVSISDKDEKRGARKLKTANGMIKKPLSLAKNLASSIVSQEIKESNSNPFQNIPTTTTYKANLSLKLIESQKQTVPSATTSSDNSTYNSTNTLIKAKQNNELASQTSQSNIPSTTKNAKNKQLQMFK
jgi:hypothetical protein